MGAPRWLRAQLSGPTGWLARPMARLLNRGNSADYRRALATLSPRPGDRVLELGFGGGVGIPDLLSRGAVITGVEPAVAMRARALRKHAWAVAKGQLKVLDGLAEALPDGPFTHALSMNTVYFWTDVQAGAAELRRVVSDTVLLGVASVQHLEQMQFHESGFRLKPPEWYAERLQEAGFEAHCETSAHGCTFVIGRAQR